MTTKSIAPPPLSSSSPEYSSSPCGRNVSTGGRSNVSSARSASLVSPVSIITRPSAETKAAPTPASVVRESRNASSGRASPAVAIRPRPSAIGAATSRSVASLSRSR